MSQVLACPPLINLSHDDVVFVDSKALRGWGLPEGGV